MANTKLSQITSGGATAGATDTVVAVRTISGTPSDVLVTPVALDTAQSWAAIQTFINSGIRLTGSSTGYTTFTSQNASATNYTYTLPAITGVVSVLTAPVSVGSATTAVLGGKYALNTAAGSVLTLPAATGSGRTIEVGVTVATTSGAHKILSNSSSDFMIGTSLGQHSNTPLMFQSPSATNHSIQMPFTGTQPSGGLVGDLYTLIDFAANLWLVSGFFSAGTTPTTPFSAANT